jgi:hypothetical protein
MKYSSIVLLILAQNIFYAQPGIDPIRVDQISTEPVKIEPQNIVKDISTPTIVPAVSVEQNVSVKPVAVDEVAPVNANPSQGVAIDLIQTQDIVVEKPNGSINWSQQYIEARGQTAIDYDRFKNKAQAKLMATRGAMVVAQRNLLEIVKGVEIVGETKVEDMITTYDYIYSRVEGKIKGAKQIGVAVERDGVIEITVRMPLYNKNGIASVFGENEIAQAQLKNGFKTAGLMPQNGQGAPILDPNKPLLFQVDGKAIDLSLFPVILDDNGQVQFDFSKLLNTKTGQFPKFLQMGKEILQTAGYEKGVNIIELIQSGKGAFKLPKNKTNGKFWQTVGTIAKTTGKILFNIPFN